MKTTLVIMAAGLATRYGGNKQITGMGPHGEILMEYSICDALRAGFEKVVFIIRPDMLDTIRAQCGDRLAKVAEVAYAFQDFASLPDWYAVPADRTKPFGTVHAVLCARDCVREPFAVINADDYYGVEAFRIMRQWLAEQAAPNRAAMVGYRLKNTVSAHGEVTRGICNAVNGCLTTVDEVQKIHLYPDGRIADLSQGEPGRTLDPQALVSMNFWGFAPDAMDAFEAEFERFLRGLAPDALKSEYVLPVMVDQLIRQNALSVSVLPTSDVWFGVTYQQDRPLVQQALAELHAKGTYPDKLF